MLNTTLTHVCDTELVSLPTEEFPLQAKPNNYAKFGSTYDYESSNNKKVIKINKKKVSCYSNFVFSLLSFKNTLNLRTSASFSIISDQKDFVNSSPYCGLFSLT